MTEKQLDELWAFIHVAFRVAVSVFAFIVGGVALAWFAIENGAH
jgi:hypothetical protein